MTISILPVVACLGMWWHQIPRVFGISHLFNFKSENFR